MRTKLVIAALATLLTVGGTAVAFAQAADTIAATNQDVISDQNQASQTYTNDNSGPNAGWSAHHHPHASRVW
jgi:hypothetical protein